jgi:hypothetical protein
MSSDSDLTVPNPLQDLIRSLGPITAHDTWLVKRRYQRVDIILPARLRSTADHGNPHAPAFTARSRDISEDGVGLVVPYKIDLAEEFQVELFTEQGTVIGCMKSVHCTQTIGGYKVGMEWLRPMQESEGPARSEGSASDSDGDQTPLTPEQVREEIREAMRKYSLGTVSRGAQGTSVEREVARIMELMPEASPARNRDEPRRKGHRHPVQGQIHFAVPAEDGTDLKLDNAEILDFSVGGVRVAAAIPDTTAGGAGKAGSLQSALRTRVVIGFWMDGGTIWLPAQVVHARKCSPELMIYGIRFVRESLFKDLR